MMSSINDSKFLYDDIKHQTELNNDIITKGGAMLPFVFFRNN